MTEIYPIHVDEVDAYAEWLGVYWSNSFTAELCSWINENIEGDWWHAGHPGVIGCEIVFEKEEDAMAFKLRWL